MFSTAKPSDDTTMHIDHQPSAEAQRPEVVSSNNFAMTQTWGASGQVVAEQVDYFASSGGFNNDSIYNTALTAGDGSWSISPIRSSRPVNVATYSAAARAYPSQELRGGEGGLELSTSPSSLTDGDMKPPPLPFPPPLPPLTTSMVASMTIGQPEESVARKFHVEEVSSMALDSFELGGAATDAIAAGQPKGEWMGDGEYSDEDGTLANRVSTSPDPKIKQQRAAKSTRKKSPGGIKTPTGVDILRGRGGLTNRHNGNMKFRDEARKLRSNYRNKNTSRKEKYLLSQDLVQRVKEYGGRFLERKGSLWYEMSEKDARKKASQGKMDITFISCITSFTCI